MTGRRVIVTTGYVRDGELKLVDRSGFVAAVKALPNCKIVLRVEEHKYPRSVRLNAYYWGVVIASVADATGYTEEEAHREMKTLHLEKSLTAMRGRGRIEDLKVFQGSTTDLSNEEENRYIENIRQWAATVIDTVIPDPGEVVAA